MSAGRHRVAPHTRSALRTPLGVTAIVVGAIAVLSITVPLGVRYAGCADTRYLRVSTALSIAPVVREAADEFNEGEHSYSGTCVFAQADQTAPHRVMTALSGGPGESTVTPDVWVPESSAWVELARVSEAGARTIETAPPSLASSPVVLAAPRGTTGLPDAGEAGWAEVLPGERDPDRPVVMVDPNRGADGMAVLHAVRRHLGTGDDADATMTDFVHDVQPDTAFGEIDLSGVYPSPGAPEPLTVVPEQAVAAYNADNPETPLVARYPNGEGTVSLDYPYVSTSEDPVLREAADDLRAVLEGADYTKRLDELGFRAPAGTAGPALRATSGITPAPPETHDDLTGDALLGAIEDWNRLSMPSRALVLADVSAAMRADLDGGPSRLEVTRDAARTGLELFPDETDLGLWLLSSELGPSGREEVEDLARLGAADRGTGTTRREELRGITDSIEVEGGGARLRDNILAAYERMQDAYDDDKINSVIVLTAGRDGGSDLSHDELVAELQDRFDPERPVTIFIIAFGEQADRDQLAEIAAATSGTLSVTSDPAEIGDIFFSSVSRRLCVPNCDE